MRRNYRKYIVVVAASDREFRRVLYSDSSASARASVLRSVRRFYPDASPVSVVAA